AAAHYANFKNMTPLPAMAEASANVDEKYQRYQAALTELIQFLQPGIGLLAFVSLVVLSILTMIHLNVEQLWERFYPQRPAQR
ncbi:Tar ligand binding domain-containing protein, partial [Salmonella enterica subsp. enterica serovar Montevideo]|nr:Tar ligand binding domain-containing protein [Salmonella enterica subsp. enterica serovar Montevideo]